MIRLTTDTPQFFSDIGEVLRLFYGDVTISPERGDVRVSHTHSEAGGVWSDTFTLEHAKFHGNALETDAALCEHIQGNRSSLSATLNTPVAQRHDPLHYKRLMKRAVKTACYTLMTRAHDKRPPWGSLTGVRPQKLLDELLEEGLTPDAALSVLTGRFDLRPDKARLLLDIHKAQATLPKPTPSDVNVYIGIPFCASRCAYCTFSAGEAQNAKLIPAYIDALTHEMTRCAKMLDEHSKPDAQFRLRAAYMGGGTPTALSAPQLDQVLRVATEAFPGAPEWTVEAGRPDTINREKLAVLKSHGVTRISINPQSFYDETLSAIGRAHTVSDTLRAFSLAREMGFDNINMDLIAALPCEDEAMFAESLSRTLKLKPESVTVHTLAIKRASKLRQEGYGIANTAAASSASRMVDLARLALSEAGYAPYYIYRQKYMADNLENVGYALAGKVCRYNVDVMQETTRTLAMGAGAISKWLFEQEPRIRRAPNVADIRAYIARVDEMIGRKRELIGGIGQ